MMDLHAKFDSLRDILEHFDRCCDAWQHSDPHAAPQLADAMRRDLDQFGRVCRAVREASLAGQR